VDADNQTVPSSAEQRADVEAAMALPEFYPHPAASVQRCETHISVVFLAGNYAYKIKKPVVLEFLDFSTLETRHHFCREEVRLNRRLTNGIYEGVVAITKTDGGLILDGPGNPVEYAVKMKRLPERHTMGRMLQRDALHGADWNRLARKLVCFYRNATPHRGLGGWDTVWVNCQENFRQMKPFVGGLISPPHFDFIRAATHGFLQHRRALFEKRLSNRRVRECHGDLRAEHIYFTPEGIQILDCIEFNARMRYNDVASDIAFLCMDLDYRGALHASQQVLTAFATGSGDLEMFSLMDFYLCYRACVRLKVTCFRLRQERLESRQCCALLERTRTFVHLACRYARRFVRPTLYVVMGMIAAGKSTVADALAGALEATVISSDRVRKMFFGKPEAPAPVAFGEGIYRWQAKARIYAKMMLLAQDRLKDGRSVVLDASFIRRKERSEAQRLAEDRNIPIVFIECVCPQQTIKERLNAREGGGSLSDARLMHLGEFQQRYEPPSEIPDDRRVIADTTVPIDALITGIFLASRKIYR
jgi:aminoglycoside phosphotransferase family enzyme/predicted kinase